MPDTHDYMFEKLFFQAAHIALLDVALKQARDDIMAIGVKHDINVTEELIRIKVAYSSIAKLGKPHE